MLSPLSAFFLSITVSSWTYIYMYSVGIKKHCPLKLRSGKFYLKLFLPIRKTCGWLRNTMYKMYVWTYQSLFPCCSQLPIMEPKGAAAAAWVRCLSCSSYCRLASRSALSLAICCRTASLWACSLALSSLIWLTISWACLSSRSRLALLSSCPKWRLSNSFFLSS